MDKISFINDKKNKYFTNIIKITDNVISIKFNGNIPDDETVIGGFFIENEFNNTNMTGDYYYNYNTIYKKDENIIMLSNDGTIYVEPEVIPIEETMITDNDNISNDLDSEESQILIETE